MQSRRKSKNVKTGRLKVNGWKNIKLKTKEERSKISDLKSHLKKLEIIEQTKPAVSGRKETQMEPKSVK